MAVLARRIYLFAPLGTRMHASSYEAWPKLGRQLQLKALHLWKAPLAGQSCACDHLATMPGTTEVLSTAPRAQCDVGEWPLVELGSGSTTLWRLSLPYLPLACTSASYKRLPPLLSIKKSKIKEAHKSYIYQYGFRWNEYKISSAQNTLFASMNLCFDIIIYPHWQ